LPIENNKGLRKGWMDTKRVFETKDPIRVGDFEGIG
jgi:hypothetical protein